VRAAEPGDKRQAKITLSFPDLKDVKVVPASFTEPIVFLKQE
jgi:hypothetical protein